MPIAKMVLVQARNSLHCNNGGICAHTCTKFDDAENINKVTAAMLVNFVSIFLGDPTSGKKCEKNTSEIDRRTRFAPLHGQMFGAYLS